MQLMPCCCWLCIFFALQMLRQDRDVNCCDYDGRTGLMLAASKGHGLAVSLLLRL